MKTCPACGTPLVALRGPPGGAAVVVDGVYFEIPGPYRPQVPGSPDAADAKRLGRRLGATASIVITFGQGQLGGSSWGDSRGASEEAANQLRVILSQLTASAPQRDARLEERRRDPLAGELGAEGMLDDLGKHLGRALTEDERERVRDIFRNPPGDDDDQVEPGAAGGPI